MHAHERSTIGGFGLSMQYELESLQRFPIRARRELERLRSTHEHYRAGVATAAARDIELSIRLRACVRQFDRMQERRGVGGDRGYQFRGHEAACEGRGVRAHAVAQVVANEPRARDPLERLRRRVVDESLERP